ncbi:glycosyltransferase [Paenibacillus luteus]|uniref:glycosyltransferase n=1 Tax=Paenibacillus luteus TaxID=2545753 RepID=UPI001375FEFF|nr:glycosyltransferase [Paenibacillus luteus]
MSESYRQGCTDGGRRRDLIEQLRQGTRLLPPIRKGIDYSLNTDDSGRHRLSVIIPAQNEETTIGRVIQEAAQLHPLEIIVIVNGSNDRTEAIACKLGAATIVFEEQLGTDVGRAIGAYAATGDCLLFVDGDFHMPWKELVPFAEAVLNDCDVAVNKLDHHLGMRAPWNSVTSLKVALNITLGRGDLDNASLVQVPFAMNKRALEVMPWHSLICPPKAYALGLLGGLRIKPVHKVEVDRMNRYRPQKHARAGLDQSLAAMQIIGDHFEAMYAMNGRERMEEKE